MNDIRFKQISVNEFKSSILDNLNDLLVSIGCERMTYQEFLRYFDQNSLVVGAFFNGVLVGIIVLVRKKQNEPAQFILFAFDPDFLESDIHKKLVGKAMEIAYSEGIVQIEVKTSDCRQNVIGFYEKAGAIRYHNSSSLWFTQAPLEVSDEDFL